MYPQKEKEKSRIPVVFHKGFVLCCAFFKVIPKRSEVISEETEHHFPLLMETFHSPLSAFPSQAQHTHDAITEAAQLMKEAVDDIMVTLNEAASEVGLVGGMVDAIAEAMSKVDLGSQMLTFIP